MAVAHVTDDEQALIEAIHELASLGYEGIAGTTGYFCHGLSRGIRRPRFE